MNQLPETRRDRNSERGPAFLANALAGRSVGMGARLLFHISFAWIVTVTFSGCHTVGLDNRASDQPLPLALPADEDTPVAVDASSQTTTNSQSLMERQNELQDSNATEPTHLSDEVRDPMPAASDLIESNSTPEGQFALSLETALRLALANSEFVSNPEQFLTDSNPLLSNPQFLQSRYDLELQRASQQSVEAALADFDARLASGVQWGRNSVIQGDNQFTASNILVSDSGTFYGRMDKPLVSGGRVSVIHNLNYASDSQGVSAGDPRFAGYVRGEYRHPLLAGHGRTFTDIAGPDAHRSRSLGHGVALADLQERMAAIDYEMGLQRLLQQTEKLYWDCWYAQAMQENQQTSLNSAQEIWDRIKSRAQTGLTGGSASDEAQAEENFYRRKRLEEAATVDLQQARSRLAHLLGLPSSQADSLIVEDSPHGVPMVFEQEDSVANALANRLELAKQNLQIEMIESQWYAAEQLRKPQLDLVSGVQANGLGDRLFDGGDSSTGGALSDLTNTDDVGWNVGVEFSMPLGFRRERLNARYLNLLLQKANAARCAQDIEIRHEVLTSVQQLEKWLQSLKSAERQLDAANRRLAATESDFRAGRASLDRVLRARDSVADAWSAVAQAKTELHKSQVDLLFRQGLLAGQLNAM